MDDYEEDYEEEQVIEEMEGGDVAGENTAEDDDDKQITITNNTMEIYKPHITRKVMSIYEFVGTITKLADYLYNLDDLNKIIENKEVYTYINHLELAWNLLKTGKYNATLNRYVEQVSFSELDVNPRWIEVIENNFKLHNQAFEDDILKPLELYKHSTF
jgi:hypothetical protein